MSSGTCINCGSHAINNHMHGRDGTYSDFCDVCFWRIRADSMKAIIEGQANEIKRLRVWIKCEADANNTCAFNVLGEVCNGCLCGKPEGLK